MWGWRPRQTWWGRRTGSPWWPSAKGKRVNIIGFFGFLSQTCWLSIWRSQPIRTPSSGRTPTYRKKERKKVQSYKLQNDTVEQNVVICGSTWAMRFLNSKFQSDLKGFVNCKAWLASFDLQLSPRQKLHLPKYCRLKPIVIIDSKVANGLHWKKKTPNPAEGSDVWIWKSINWEIWSLNFGFNCGDNPNRNLCNAVL